MKKPTKYEYLWIIQGNYGYGYGHGWEDLSAYENRKEMRVDLKAYHENEPQYPHRVINRRVLRPQPHPISQARVQPGTQPLQLE